MLATSHLSVSSALTGCLILALLAALALGPSPAAAGDRAGWQVIAPDAAGICAADGGPCVVVRCTGGAIEVGLSTAEPKMHGTRALAPMRIDRQHVGMLDGLWRDDPRQPGRQYAAMTVRPDGLVIRALASGNRLDINRGLVLPLRGSAKAIEQVTDACG